MMSENSGPENETENMLCVCALSLSTTSVGFLNTLPLTWFASNARNELNRSSRSTWTTLSVSVLLILLVITSGHCVCAGAAVPFIL